jgi:hypothetical protein
MSLDLKLDTKEDGDIPTDIVSASSTPTVAYEENEFLSVFSQTDSSTPTSEQIVLELADESEAFKSTSPPEAPESPDQSEIRTPDSDFSESKSPFRPRSPAYKDFPTTTPSNWPYSPTLPAISKSLKVNWKGFKKMCSLRLPSRATQNNSNADTLFSIPGAATDGTREYEGDLTQSKIAWAKAGPKPASLATVIGFSSKEGTAGGIAAAGSKRAESPPSEP